MRLCCAVVWSYLILHPSSLLLADSIWLVGSDRPLYTAARITRVEKGQLYFVINGNETSRELERIGRISVDDEPALTAAETALAQQKWDDAVDGYEKVIRASSKAWVKDWAGNRLIDAAGKSGRFDSAVTAWVLLVQRDATAAAKAKPALPDSKSSYLDTAAQQVDRGLAARNLSDEQRTLLLSFLLEIHAARGDANAANAIAEKLDETLAKDPKNPAAARANVRRKLQAASGALSGGRFEEAEQTIQVNRAIFDDPTDQAEALYILAEARFARAGEEKTKLQDAAIAFMRVVAVAKDAPGRPRVADALAKSAEICEKLGDVATAQRLYEEVAREYPDSPVAASARAAVAKLNAASKK